jgi:hypothetical protein
MRLITQPVRILPCSNSAMNIRILYHDIATQTITEPPPCFTVGTRHSRLQASLGIFLM